MDVCPFYGMKYLLFIVCLWGCSIARTQQSKSVISEGKVHDWGELAEGDVVEKQITYKNTGKVPIQVIRCHSSGGHLYAWADIKQPILPGKIGVIHLSYDTRGGASPFNKSVWFVYRDTSEHNIVFTVKGTVKKKELIDSAQSG